MSKLKLVIIVLVGIYSAATAQHDEYIEEYQAQYQENITKEYIRDIYIPKDIDDAIEQLDMLSQEEGRQKMLEAPEEIVAERLTRGLGKWIITNWNFYNGSRMSHYLKGKGISHPEDMAEYIIVSYYRYHKGSPLELDARAIAYQKKRKKEQEERNKKRTTTIISD